MGVVRRTGPEEWQLVDKLYPSLHRFAAVVAPWDVDADDLLHDALVDVLGKHSLLELDHPAAYLRKVMVNKAAGLSRRMGAQKRALDKLVASMSQYSDPSYPSDMADLERLPPKQRAVLYLSEVEGYHFDEIARMLDCSESGARKVASRARKYLRVELARGDLK